MVSGVQQLFKYPIKTKRAGMFVGEAPSMDNTWFGLLRIIEYGTTFLYLSRKEFQ